MGHIDSLNNVGGYSMYNSRNTLTGNTMKHLKRLLRGLLPLSVVAVIFVFILYAPIPLLFTALALGFAYMIGAMKEMDR